VAALFHDIGKANEDFYAAVDANKPLPQLLRHEHLSAVVLCLPEVRQWLTQNELLDVDVITAAVLSHHLKASRSGEKWKWCQPRTLKKSLRLYLDHPEITTTFNQIAKMANLTGVPTFNLGFWTKEFWEKIGPSAINYAERLAKDIKTNSDRLALLLAVKAGVIVSDASSSGLVRNDHEIRTWINAVVHQPSIEPDEINRKIIQERGQQIEKKTKQKFDLKKFQKHIAEQGSRVLLLAACAAGKTLAAWNWAEAQARCHEIGKVIFLYPTRGTATEGFRDYVSWAPEADAALVHGTARYELEAMRENPSEAMVEKTFEKLTEDQERLYALGLWSRRFFSATVDQFLAFIEHSYTGLCLLPVLADSAVIIDEVHSFDRRMFGALLAFLKHFNVPVLCMTATLPTSRREQLLEAKLTLYPNDELRAEFIDLIETEDHPRYRLEPMTDTDEAMGQAVKAYSKGKRVLWVVNRVDECQRIAARLEKRLKIKVLTYHSRFKLEDRQKRHAKTIEAFQQKEQAAIAVTTQVCEMSLDLDADVLITEIAPVSSLVQRFGRANRHLAHGKDFRAVLHTYPSKEDAPYTKDELVVAARFLDSLGAGDVSQRRLSLALEEFSVAERKLDDSVSFLKGGYFAVRGEFRDTDDFTTPCVLNSSEDLDRLKALLDEHRPYDGLIVGAPHKHVGVKKDHGITWLPKYLSIADAAYYDAERGYKKQLDQE
jgi:CRISPR-associated endonuclease/helicase Cas3